MMVACRWEAWRKQLGAMTRAGPEGSAISLVTRAWSRAARCSKVGPGLSRPKNVEKWFVSAYVAIRRILDRPSDEPPIEPYGSVVSLPQSRERGAVRRGSTRPLADSAPSASKRQRPLGRRVLRCAVVG